LSCTLMLALSMFQGVRLGYVALVLYTVNRALIFPVFFSYIAVTFGPNNYGRLIGVACFCSGAFGYVNAPVARWSGFEISDTAVCPAGGVVCHSWARCAMVNGILAASLLPLILYSAWLWRRSKLVGPPSEPASPHGTRPQSRQTSP
jgi:hypothetical protein